MTRGLPAILFLLMATGASAANWQYDGWGVPIAYIDNGAAQFQFACRGGDLTMGYWVRAPQRQVAGAASIHVSITPDPPGGRTSYAQDLPVIHADGSSVVVRGPVAREWARIAQQAKSAMKLAFVRTDGAGKREIFDSHEFDARGSMAAIRRVLDRCG